MLRAIPVLLCAALLAAMPVHAPAKGPLPEPDEGPDPRGLTLSGTGLAYVKAPPRPTDAKIEQAIRAVRPKALARAVEQARGRAQALAGAAGLTLGDIQAVSGGEPGSEIGFVPRHCSARCVVPLYALATVKVTFATAQTSAATPAGSAIVATATAAAKVTPVNRRSSASIRQALVVARLAAAPRALTAARSDGDATASAAGVTPGALFSIAEVRRPFDDWENGSFGPGRFCGTVRRAIVRRDPDTGRQRVVRRVTQRRCPHPTQTSVVLRVTWLPG